MRPSLLHEPDLVIAANDDEGRVVSHGVEGLEVDALLAGRHQVVVELRGVAEVVLVAGEPVEPPAVVGLVVILLLLLCHCH